MAALTQFYTFWSGNTTLSNALPISNIYLGTVPPNITYPYASLIEIATIPILNTGKSFIENWHFQLTLYSQDLNSLDTLADTIDNVLNKAVINSSGLTCQRQNRLSNSETQAEFTTYSIMLEYIWMYNSTLP